MRACLPAGDLGGFASRVVFGGHLLTFFKNKKLKFRLCLKSRFCTTFIALFRV